MCTEAKLVFLLLIGERMNLISGEFVCQTESHLVAKFGSDASRFVLGNAQILTQNFEVLGRVCGYNCLSLILFFS